MICHFLCSLNSAQILKLIEFVDSSKFSNWSINRTKVKKGYLQNAQHTQNCIFITNVNGQWRVTQFRICAFKSECSKLYALYLTNSDRHAPNALRQISIILKEMIGYASLVCCFKCLLYWLQQSNVMMSGRVM